MADISASMSDAESPMEFVKRNLERLHAQNPATRPITMPEPTPPPPPPAATVQNPDQELNNVVRETETKRGEIEKQAADHAKAIEEELTKTAESAAGPAEAQEEAPVQADNEGAEEPNPEDSKEINFRALRKTVNEHKQQIAEKEKELAQLKEKVEKYETGEELPEPIKERVSRIEELEYYEKLHALKKSPHYKEKYIKPLNDVHTQLFEYAKDYEIPAEVMQQALRLKNRAQLNAFLSDHFDEVGALEVKNMIMQVHELQGAAEKAELEPLEVLQRMEEENKILQQQEQQKTRQVFSETAKSAWVESLIKIRDEGKALELIPTETDPDRTKHYVEPILQAASKDYARIVKLLADNGMKNLPKDLALALARSCQLATASKVSIERANAASSHADEIERSATRMTKYIRPPVGGSIGRDGGQSGPQQDMTPQKVADALINQVMGKRR